MKWFKHFSDNHRGQTQQYFMDELGHFGPCGYYILVEMCAEKLDRKTNGEVTADDCAFSFHRRVVESALRAKRAAIVRLLDCGTTANLLQYKVTGDFFEIKMPKLLELLEYDQKKSRQKTAVLPNRSRLDKDKDKDKDKDTDKDKDIIYRKVDSVAKKNAIEQRRKIKAAYIDAYRLRYGIDPATHSAKFNTLVASLHKQIGTDEAIELVKFYLTHNDSFYIKNTHSFGLCLRDVDTLRTQMIKGMQITSTKIRNFEREISTQETISALEKAWGNDK